MLFPRREDGFEPLRCSSLRIRVWGWLFRRTLLWGMFEPILEAPGSAGLGHCSPGLSLADGGGWEGAAPPQGPAFPRVSAGFHFGFDRGAPKQPQEAAQHRAELHLGGCGSHRAPGEMGTLPELSSLASSPPNPSCQGNKPSPKSSPTGKHGAGSCPHLPQPGSARGQLSHGDRDWHRTPRLPSHCLPEQPEGETLARLS